MATLRSPVLERAPIPAVAEPAFRPEPKQRRDPWFDNTKMVLIVLVVLGHTWSQLPATQTSTWAYHFIYLFHMPAFVLVTGYLSRSMTWEPARVWSLVRTVAVPYLLFESALLELKHLMGDHAVAHPLLVPNSPMWFLVALFAWRLITPLVLRIPRWPAIAASVAISLASGLVTWTELDLARILGFLPFFVVGLHLRREDWDRLRHPAVLPAAIAVLGAYLVVARHLVEHLPTDWLYYDYPYAALHTAPVAGMVTRLVLIASGLLGAAAVFAVVPRVRSWFTTLGSATLIVYLFHDFFVVALGRSSYPDAVGGNLALAFWWPTAVAITLALLLATPPVVRRLSPLADPLGWLQGRVQDRLPERKQEQEPRRAPTSA
ncbi:MAG: acyltransferase family protein [Marmoricola sp.]